MYPDPYPPPRTSALREVYAHAVLGKHQHILQYYSAWAEDKHMIIQVAPLGRLWVM